MDGRDIYDNLPRDPKTTDPIVPPTRQLYLIEAKSAGYTRGEVAAGYVSDSVLWGGDTRESGDIESSVSSSSSHTATPIQIKLPSPLTSPRLAQKAPSPRIGSSPRLSGSPKVMPSSPISKMIPCSLHSAPHAKPVNEFYVEDDDDDVSLSSAGTVLTSTPKKTPASASMTSPFVFGSAVKTPMDSNQIKTPEATQPATVPTPPVFSFTPRTKSAPQPATPVLPSPTVFSFIVPPVAASLQVPPAPIPSVAEVSSAKPIQSENTPGVEAPVQTKTPEPTPPFKASKPSPVLYTHRHHDLMEKEGLLTSTTLQRLLQICYDRWYDTSLARKYFRQWAHVVKSRRDVQCDLETQLQSLNMRIIPRQAHTHYARPKYHRSVTTSIENISLLELISAQLPQHESDASDNFLKVGLFDVTESIASLVQSEQGILQRGNSSFHICIASDDSEIANNTHVILAVVPVFLSSQDRMQILDRLPSATPVIVLLLASAPALNWRYRWMEIDLDMSMPDLNATFADIRDNLTAQQIHAMFLIEPSEDEEDAEGLLQCLSATIAPLIACSTEAPLLMRVDAMDWIESTLVRAVSGSDDVMSAISDALTYCQDTIAMSEELYSSTPHPTGESYYCRLRADYVFPANHSKYRQCPIDWGEDATFRRVREILDSLCLPDDIEECCDYVVSQHWDGATSLVSSLRSARHAPDLSTEIALTQRAWLRCIHARAMQLQENSFAIYIPYIAEEDAAVPIPVPQVRRLEAKQRQEPPKKPKLFVLRDEDVDTSPIPVVHTTRIQSEANALLESIVNEGDMFSMLEECLGDELKEGKKLKRKA